MKIDDIFRKCIEIPGVSIKRSEFNAELLMKTKEGKGSMTFFQLFPGLTIAYIFINHFRKFIIRHSCCPFFDCTLLHLYRCFQTAAKACAHSKKKCSSKRP